MPKVYAFDPPTNPSPRKPITRIGAGAYYAALRMRKSDVERRLRMHNETGKEYLETMASYNVHKNKMKEEDQ